MILKKICAVKSGGCKYKPNKKVKGKNKGRIRIIISV
jgi:hypothetical protein